MLNLAMQERAERLIAETSQFVADLELSDPSTVHTLGTDLVDRGKQLKADADQIMIDKDTP